MSLPKADILNHLTKELLDMKPDLQDKVNADKHFMWELGLDSLDITEFIARTEQHFRIEIPDDIWRDLDNLDKIADYLIAQTHD
ncbi:MAG: phosphopantetheine-binding protein [Bacteroidota bacterium]